MKSGGWIPISKAFVKSLPKDRPYTELEAAYCLQIDYDKNNTVTVTGYSHLWQWGKKRVYRFFKRMGIAIEYPDNTTNIQRQRGHIKIGDCKETEKSLIRLIDNRGLEHTTTLKGDRKRPATIDKDKDKEHTRKKPCPYGQVFDLMREILPELPQPTKMTGLRKKHFAARWHSAVSSKNGLSSNSIEFWEGFFRYIRESDFLMGRNNSKFRASFDWIIRESNFIKIMEGNYHE
jgi:hypothetical protein